MPLPPVELQRILNKLDEGVLSVKAPTAMYASYSRGRRCMIEPNYRSYRIEVTAVRVDGAWNANIRIRHGLGDMQPHIEVVTCRKPTAKAAEERAVVYARRWVDRHRAG